LVGILSGYACLGLSILIVAEILARKLLNLSIQGVDEIGGYVVAVTGTFGMALAAAHRAHTRIDILLVRLPGRAQAVLNIAAYLALAASAAFMAFMGWATLEESLAFGSRASTPLQTPLWLPQGLWLAGLLLFGATALVMAIRALRLLPRGLSAANAALAPPTVAEEIDEARR
ncbi:MAG: TRAP transporter small permease, partial [Pseudomonadota bacterium]